MPRFLVVETLTRETIVTAEDKETVFRMTLDPGFGKDGEAY